MSRAPDPEFRTWVELARGTPIADVCDRHGVSLRRGTVERTGGCPVCGDGGKRDSDRFGINTTRNVFACRKCNTRGGDVIALVMWLTGCEFVAACQSLTGMEPPGGGGASIDLGKLEALNEERRVQREAALAAEADYREAERLRCWELWERAKPAAGSPVEDYLRLRRLTLPPTKALRYAPAARLYGDKRKGERPPLLHTGPAMYAAIRGRDGRFAGLHMTWIDLTAADGKARVLDQATGELTPAKKVRGSQRGNHIELVRCADPVGLVIGEGNETVLSRRDDWLDAGQDLTGVAFWCAINVGNLGGPSVGSVAHPTLKGPAGRPQRCPDGYPSDKGAAIELPDSVQSVLILGDGDSDPFATRLHCERASRRWARPGRAINGDFAPDGMDHNDVRRTRA